jgi:hypothetical protein
VASKVPDMSWLGPAIDVRPLFAGQQAAFMDLLGQLSAARARTEGDQQLSAAALQMVSIIWSPP